MIIEEGAHLAHYGILRRSGRYPWGSGGTQEKRNKLFLDHIGDLRKQGLTETEIVKGTGLESTTQLRALLSIAKNQQKAAQIAHATKLKNKGLSNVAIGEKMGLNESSVRALLAPGAADKSSQLEATAKMLREQVAKKQFVDVGTGVEYHATDKLGLGVSENTLKVATAMLVEEGYRVHTVQVDQIGTGSGQKTSVKVLAPPGTEYPDIAKHKEKIQQITDYSTDGGYTYLGIVPPLSVNSKRLRIKYAEDGGAEADGVVYVRPGKEDLSLGGKRYAQVRIAVDGTHYIKGMAVYKNDMPPGVDLIFNTNKPKGGNKLDALKPLNRDEKGNIDPENPFGAMVRQIHKTDANGVEIPDELTSAMNIVNDEGTWDKWSRTLSSQFLSKQKPELAKAQLDVTFERRKAELEEIMSMTNPAVRKKLLMDYADSADAAAVHLKVAAFRGQKTQVILPINSLKDTEVYAPNFNTGDRVALVRFPHGGKFEIPQLVVNNNHRESKALLGDSKDAIGINSRVASHLSGADFDGDTVLVIPNNRNSVKSMAPLDGLKNFNPKHDYPEYDGMTVMDERTMQREMGKVSNLITDMTIKGASTEELARAVRHSMVVIDAKKHKLNYKQSAEDNGIAQLKTKYQGGPNKGASTLISRSGLKATVKVPKMELRRPKDGGPIDPKTGQLVYVPTGETYVDKKTGKTVPLTSEHPRLALVTDAHSLSSGTAVESHYADYSNNLKDLANLARKEAVNTRLISAAPSAKKVFSKEVATLDAKLNIALKNRPLERQAQIIANANISARRKSNPDMEKAELKKISNQALEVARIRMGAKKERISITDSEWQAIQAGAVSPSKLSKILDNADMDRVKALAKPRVNRVMTSAKTSRAKAMLASGYTQADIARQLGVPLSTLNSALGR